MCQNDTRSNAPGSTISKEVECFDLFAQSLFGLFALNRQALKSAGAFESGRRDARPTLSVPTIWQRSQDAEAPG